MENYETELHNLGEHVEIPETPIKIIKITKTVAVKVPVPYPVKVIEKVPYPVHISKPYPVPVPHIVKVPHVESPPKLHGHEALGSNDDTPYPGQGHYQVQEVQSPDSSSNGDSYNGGQSDYTHNFLPYNDDYSSEGNSYNAPSINNYYGNADSNDAGSINSQSYDTAIKGYLRNLNAGNGLENNNHH